MGQKLTKSSKEGKILDRECIFLTKDKVYLG